MATKTLEQPLAAQDRLTLTLAHEYTAALDAIASHSMPRVSRSALMESIIVKWLGEYKARKGGK